MVLGTSTGRCRSSSSGSPTKAKRFPKDCPDNHSCAALVIKLVVPVSAAHKRLEQRWLVNDEFEDMTEQADGGCNIGAVGIRNRVHDGGTRRREPVATFQASMS